MRVTTVTRGPLFEASGSFTARLRRRTQGILAEVLAFVALTLLSPIAVVLALLVDGVLLVLRRKPPTALRLVAYAWWFLQREMRALLALIWIWASTGGPFGRGSLRRRRLVYDLRIRWAYSHLSGVRVLFGLTFEIEGLELAGPGPVLIFIRHASIIDNMLPDALVGREHGIGLRFVLKREMEMIPTIDIAGRWVPANFVRRASGDPEAELANLRTLAHDLGAGEGILIYPEGTRYTPEKLARAQEIIAERQPEIAPLANQLEHLLPPRLGGPLALIDEAPGTDIVLCGHIGLDGFEYISDIWSGGLVGTTVRIKFWRFPAAEIPTSELGRIEWLYARWQTLDDWIGAQQTR